MSASQAVGAIGELGPVVRVLPLQPHCLAFGGFELQMLAALDSVRSAGVDVAQLDAWSRDDRFDVLHCWGLHHQHENAARWAHRDGKRVIISALVPYPNWKARTRRRLRLNDCTHALRRELANAVDAITVVNDEQKNALREDYGVPSDRIRVIPNIIADVFFAKPAFEPISDLSTGLRDYVLATGNVCPRKNQLALARACRALDIPLVLVGNVLTGDDEYGMLVALEISGSPKMHWIRGLSPGSPALVGAYLNAAIVALPSHDETQPISALEAVAMGKPLLLADRPYARQRYYENADRIDPNSEASIAEGLRRVMMRPADFTTPREVVAGCRADAVGEAYAAMYRAVVAGGRP